MQIIISIFIVALVVTISVKKGITIGANNAINNH